MDAALATPRLLSAEDFARLVRSAPLVSVDLIVRNGEGEVLVALRDDEPEGYLFVPGGIVLKAEPIEAAFGRIVAREIGCRMSYEIARFRGVSAFLSRQQAWGGNGDPLRGAGARPCVRRGRRDQARQNPFDLSVAVGIGDSRKPRGA